MATIIDGKLVSQTIRGSIKDEVSALKAELGITPGLAVVLVGDDPASAVYVRNKHKACIDAGIESYVITMPADTKEDDLLAKIDELKAKLADGSLKVFDASTFTKDGAALTSYMADVDTDSAFTPDTEVIKDGYFHESEYRSAPYFDIRIDGITCLN